MQNRQLLSGEAQLPGGGKRRHALGCMDLRKKILRKKGILKSRGGRRRRNDAGRGEKSSWKVIYSFYGGEKAAKNKSFAGGARDTSFCTNKGKGRPLDPLSGERPNCKIERRKCKRDRDHQ